MSRYTLVAKLALFVVVLAALAVVVADAPWGPN